MIRKKKLYSRPTNPFEKSRIEEENVLVKKYGLKNKREVWKALAKVNYFRKRAMALVESPIEEQEVFFNKLKKVGLNASTITEVLALNIEDLLKRRLPTVVLGKGLANTAKQARQFVVHKGISIGGKIVDSPSYIVSVDEENIINSNIDLKAASRDKETKNEEAVQNG